MPNVNENGAIRIKVIYGGNESISVDVSFYLLIWMEIGWNGFLKGLLQIAIRQYYTNLFPIGRLATVKNHHQNMALNVNGAFFTWILKI